MTDLRKAAEMALEALERGTTGLAIRAIPALRQALAQPEQESPKREWVGLTEDDMHTIRGDAFNKNVDDMNWAVAIARKIDFILRKRNT